MGEFYYDFQKILWKYFQEIGEFERGREKFVREIIQDKESVIQKFKEDIESGKIKQIKPTPEIRIVMIYMPADRPVEYNWQIFRRLKSRRGSLSIG